MNDKELKCANIKSDIDEIDEVLNAQAFDRKKGEDVIRKHNVTDETVAQINSPLVPGFMPFNQASDDMVRNNLVVIRQVLLAKLAKEQSNG